MGRPSKFSPELAERICAKLAEGSTVEAFADDKNMPSPATIYRWLATQDAVAPENGQDQSPGPFASFREAYARACELRAAPRFERLRKLADDVAEGRIDPQAARAAADIEKWCLGREQPKKYGDAMTVRGDKENPIRLEAKVAREMTDEELTVRASGGLREVY